ncbi:MULTISPECIES: hypothetical protein [unclassified Xanthobacter]|uniref:hypothetical protein n=1 Tax=unclassified Xanthobacter TaxID=2623496 RepID=UPI001F28407F|nr:MULTISPECIES: hypothetical protein [unclassified Xanthobacter]
MGYSIERQFPRTISGLKSKAKKIARRDSLPHCAALDRAARESGAHDYQHFRRLYGGTQSILPFRHEIILEQEWEEAQSGQPRRVALRLPLSRAVDDLPCRGIGRLPRVRIRHRKGNRFLIDASNSSNEEFAREDLVRVARTIQFVDATGLVLANARSWRRAPYPRYRGLDHPSTWMNPETGRPLHVDEPYADMRGTLLGPFNDSGQLWCQENQFDWLRPNWAGMYSPELCCDFILMSHKIEGEPLVPVARKLEAYHPAVLTWTADFIS